MCPVTLGERSKTLGRRGPRRTEMAADLPADRGTVRTSRKAEPNSCGTLAPLCCCIIGPVAFWFEPIGDRRILVRCARCLPYFFAGPFFDRRSTCPRCGCWSGGHRLRPGIARTARNAPLAARDESNPIWDKAQDVLGVPLVGSISIARNQPWFELGRPLVCMLALSCGFLVGTNDGRARQLLNVIAWSGVVYAAFGILAHVFDPGHILWRDKDAYLESVTATFINRNTAGAYFGSCALVWSLLLWERIQRRLQRGAALTWSTINPLLATPPTPVIVTFMMLFLCLAAMFMTLSRGATVLSLLALVVGFVLFFRRHLPRRAAFVTALAGGVAMVFVLLEVMGAGINARFDSEGLTSGGRFETYKATLRLIGDHPWFGTGQGTFAYAFPAYRGADAPIWGVWDVAHNTLLEIAADMGIPIAMLVTVGWAIIFCTLINGVIVRKRGVILPVAALTVALVAVLHSLFDFSLQIPGYSIVVLALIGAGLAQSFRRHPNGNRAPQIVPSAAFVSASESAPPTGA